MHQVGSLGNGRPFLAMRLIKGRTLEAILKQRRDPSAERGRLLAIFEAVCHAVGYAHAHRVIHRDLKPANVMAGAFGEVQVLDWGLAKVLGKEDPATAEALAADQTCAWTQVTPTPETGSYTQAGSLVGTPSAPRSRGSSAGQIDKGRDQRADVFGLGAVLAAILELGTRPCRRVVRGRGRACRRCVANWRVAFARADASGAEPELVALCKMVPGVRAADWPANAARCAGGGPVGVAAHERARRAEVEPGAGRRGAGDGAARAAELRKRRWLVLGAAAVVTAGSMIAAYRISVEKSEADRQRAEADKQKVAAEHNASIADEERGLAREAEKQAKANGDLAGQQAKLALNTIYDVVTTADEKLRSRADMGPLRKKLLQLVMSRLDKISGDVVTSGKADRTMGAGWVRTASSTTAWETRRTRSRSTANSPVIFNRLMQEQPEGQIGSPSTRPSPLRRPREMGREVEPDLARLDV